MGFLHYIWLFHLFLCFINRHGQTSSLIQEIRLNFAYDLYINYNPLKPKLLNLNCSVGNTFKCLINNNRNNSYFLCRFLINKNGYQEGKGLYNAPPPIIILLFTNENIHTGRVGGRGWHKYNPGGGGYYMHTSRREFSFTKFIYTGK